MCAFGWQAAGTATRGNLEGFVRFDIPALCFVLLCVSTGDTKTFWRKGGGGVQIADKISAGNRQHFFF